MFVFRTLLLMAPIGLVALLAACATAPPPSSMITYDNTIRHLIEKQCSECHGSNAPNMSDFKKDEERYKAKDLGPRMDTYENLLVMVNGSDAGAIMRRLDDGTSKKDGKPGNMYKQLGANEAQRATNLFIFKSWLGSWNLKRARDLGDEERKSVLAPRN